MALFNAAEVVTAAKMNALVGYSIKSADQSVTSSATVVNDTHLSYVVPAVGTYIVDAWLYALSAANAAGDLRVGFSFPTGTMHVGGIGPGSSLASGTESTSEHLGILGITSGSSVTNIPYGLSASGNPNTIHVHGILIAAATGTLRLQWAQLISNGNASTLKAGSHMLVKRVA